jgi:hypothetical protein
MENHGLSLPSGLQLLYVSLPGALGTTRSHFRAGHVPFSPDLNA